MDAARRARMRDLSGQLTAILDEMREIRRASGRGPFDDAILAGVDGPVRLSELFGDKADLIVIQNMGRRCAYCTMWADGLAGLAPHLSDRASVVLASPDPPAVQQAFARERGWPFRMVSTAGTDFKRRLGFEREDGAVLPGVSVFHKAADGSVVHAADDDFGPGDLYNGAWHLFGLLEGGVGDWEPRLRYG